MSIKIENMKMPGYTNIKEGPLPVLRNKDEHLKVDYDKTVPQNLAKGFGKFSGYRALPYKMQNHYERSSELKDVKTIVYENEKLKAVFLPEFGGRLYSLYNKRKNRELLSVNPVFQPANLANRNAWFSGGIEWNIGQYGHTFLTCEPVFFAVCKNDNGEDFLRMFEYERAKKVFYQIDFYLPKDADYIVTYTKIINPYNEDTSIYYWSNTAVSELNHARVFSDNKDVIYIKSVIDKDGKMRNSMSYGQLPELEGVEADASYPRNFTRANEYFYLNKKEQVYPWEAVAYDDGSLFYECSTRPLTYRKMFCWGTHEGGTKWQRFLSHDAPDRYVEIQAGIFPTQLHSDAMKANSSIEFMQIFGLKNVDDNNKVYASYDEAKEYVYNQIYTKKWTYELKIYDNAMKNMSVLPVHNVISNGRGWGSLELKRAEKNNNKLDLFSMDFAENSLDAQQEYWLNILEKKNMSEAECSLNKSTTSFMVDDKWLKHIENAIKNEKNKTILEKHILNKAIILSENFEDREALEVLMSYLNDDSSAMYLRTVGAQLIKNNELNKAIGYYEKAYEKLEPVDVEYFEEDFTAEYLELLINTTNAEKVWEIYQDRLTENKNITEEMSLNIGQAAAELGYWEVVDEIIKNAECVTIREGNTILVELWFRKQVNDRGDITLEEARRQLRPPEHIDFRMV